MQVDASQFRAGSLPASPASLSSHLLADQISVADILVGSKADCCDDATLDAFHEWARGLRPAKLLITTARHGRIDCAAASTLLSWPVHASSGSTLQPVVSAQQAPQQLEPQQGLPVQRLRRETSRPAVPWLSSAGVDESRQADLDGCSSGTAMAHHGSDQPHNQWFERKEVQDSSGEHLACGWIFAPRCQFDEQRLLALLQELAPACLRLKGVFRVSAACFKAASAASTPGAPPAAASCQQAACAVELQEIAYQHDSRLEVILSTATAQQPAAVGHTMGVQDGSAVLASSGDMPGTWRQQVASGLVAAAGRDWHLLELLLLSTLQAAD
jgi:G3E family GTPase